MHRLNWKVNLPLHRILQICLLSMTVIFNLLQFRLGLADNGDWARMSIWFSSGPVGFSDMWPLAGTKEFKLRFFNYWIPDWKFNFDQPHDNFSSVLFLWIPGLLLNYHLYSPITISIPILSIFPRLLCLILLWVIFRWINNYTRHQILFTVAIGFPLALILSTTDYIVYFNSLYQEAGVMVYLPLLIVVILIIRKKGLTLPLILLYLLSITSLCMTKSSYFYWSALALPFVFPISKIIRRPLPNVPIALALMVFPAYLSLHFTIPGYGKTSNPYDSLFFGALTFSDKPQWHLQQLGYPTDSVRCIGKNAFVPGNDCPIKYADMIHYRQLIQVDLAEPIILVRQLKFAADQAQVLSLNYLGKVAYGDNTTYRKIRLNLWSEIKKSVFPRGLALIITLIGFFIIFSIALRQSGPIGYLGTIGLLMSLGSLIELNVEIIGDGRMEITKHLLLANLTFDFALVCLLGLLAAFYERWLEGRKRVDSL